MNVIGLYVLVQSLLIRVSILGLSLLKMSENENHCQLCNPRGSINLKGLPPPLPPIPPLSIDWDVSVAREVQGNGSLESMQHHVWHALYRKFHFRQKQIGPKDSLKWRGVPNVLKHFLHVQFNEGSTKQDMSQGVDLSNYSWPSLYPKWFQNKK